MYIVLLLVIIIFFFRYCLVVHFYSTLLIPYTIHFNLYLLHISTSSVLPHVSGSIYNLLHLLLCSLE